MPFKGTPMSETGTDRPVQKQFRVAEVAARFGVNETTVYRQIKAGRLKAIRIGTGRGTVRVPAEALAEYEESITAAAVESADLTVDTPLGPVDMVAIDRARSGRQVELTMAEVAFLALLDSRSLAGLA
jgi:excisionase family DNA binding protein